MATLVTDQKLSEYNQQSFLGGMNLLGDDSRLQPNQYRIGFDLTNRYDILDPVLASVQDKLAPEGVIQECATLGNYVILFVSGFAYYRYYTDIVWTQITGFAMSKTAPRYWSKAIPVSTTNYARFAATFSTTSQPNPAGGINLSQIVGASAGNLPGLLVQDNVTQPQFIYLQASTLTPVARTTQRFSQWNVQYTDATNTVVATNGDQREYVPIGNVMAWANGILEITSQDTNFIYRSVSGRPLDFVVNVTNILAANTTIQEWIYIDPITFTQYSVEVQPFQSVGGGAFNALDVFFPGGDATTTSYSVGVGGITCLRELSTGGIFVFLLAVLTFKSR